MKHDNKGRAAPVDHQPRRNRRIFWTTLPGIVTAAGTAVMALAMMALVVLAVMQLSKSSEAGSPVGSSVEELVKATVEIRAVDENGEWVWLGSGSMIRGDGLILTAGHLVDDRLDEYDHLEVGVTDDISEAPEPEYRATVSAVDYALDVAVISIESDLKGDPVVMDRPFVAVGDSNETQILDRIRILGYPDVGGKTLTGTAGTVSGFEFQDNVEGRGFVKTDAAILAGSSGGMAVNDAGELIAVPTEIGSGDREASLVDCERAIADTNGDGLIDDADSCVPVGGFINALRPVNLAKPLIDAVESGTRYEARLPEPEPVPVYAYDPLRLVFDNLRFSAGRSDNGERVRAGSVLPSGITQVCGFWDYDGMIDDVRWDAVWNVDSFRSDEHSKLRQRWSVGESGTGGPVCIENDSGLADGVYELNLSVDGYPLLADGVFVGGEHPIITFTLENRSNSDICGVYFSAAGMIVWGQNRLPARDVIEPNESHSFQLPAGVYDISADDCEDQELDAVYEHAVADGGTLTVAAQAP